MFHEGGRELFLGGITSKKGVKRDKEYHMNVQVLKNSACKSIYNMQSYWKRKEIYNRNRLNRTGYKHCKNDLLLFFIPPLPT